MNFAVILAAGKGKRFGKEKQFVLIKNKPIIFYSIQKFNKSSAIDKIIVVTTKSRIIYVNTLIKKHHFTKVTNVVVGGKERQDSMLNALRLLPDKGYVAIHDVARPLINEQVIVQGFNCAKKHRACIPTIPISDTVKVIQDNKVVRTIDRSQLHYVQTPQFFEIRLLKMAYAKAYKNNHYATDDANLVERLGVKVHLIPGLKQNIKITDERDFVIVKALI